MLSPTYEITTALSHTDELISPPYDIAIVTISYGRVTMSSVWDSMMSKKNMGWPFYAAVVSRNKLLENSRCTGDLRPLNAHETPLQCSIDICMIYTRVLPPTNSHFTTANSNALHAGYSHSGSLFAFKWLYNEYEHSWLVVVFRPSDNHYQDEIKH